MGRVLQGLLVMEWAAVLKNSELVRVLSEAFPTPTEVQTACLQPATEFRQDLVIATRTGSGKTLCFGIPITDRILPCQSLKALILTPTRELALLMTACRATSKS
jgi:superfamily II DNA/RNA helicase